MSNNFMVAVCTQHFTFNIKKKEVKKGQEKAVFLVRCLVCCKSAVVHSINSIINDWSPKCSEDSAQSAKEEANVWPMIKWDWSHTFPWKDKRLLSPSEDKLCDVCHLLCCKADLSNATQLILLNVCQLHNKPFKWRFMASVYNLFRRY